MKLPYPTDIGDSVFVCERDGMIQLTAYDIEEGRGNTVLLSKEAWRALLEWVNKTEPFL